MSINVHEDDHNEQERKYPVHKQNNLQALQEKCKTKIRWDYSIAHILLKIEH
jgi:hypothetical protein